MKTEQEIKNKIKELEEEYQYMTPYDVEFVYLPEQIKILKWVLKKSLNWLLFLFKFKVF